MLAKVAAFPGHARTITSFSTLQAYPALTAHKHAWTIHVLCGVSDTIQVLYGVLPTCAELLIHQGCCELNLPGWCESALCISALCCSCNNSKSTVHPFLTFKGGYENDFFSLVFSRKMWREAAASSNMEDHNREFKCLRWEEAEPGAPLLMAVGENWIVQPTCPTFWVLYYVRWQKFCQSAFPELNSVHIC